MDRGNGKAAQIKTPAADAHSKRARDITGVILRPRLHRTSDDRSSVCSAFDELELPGQDLRSIKNIVELGSKVKKEISRQRKSPPRNDRSGGLTDLLVVERANTVQP
jgi:hypothetical protein